MSCDLFLRGELRIKPGHEAAVEALNDLIDAEEGDAITLNGNLAEIGIDENVNVSHYTTVWDALLAFVDDHCETAAVIQTGPSEREFSIFGSDPAQRVAALARYCENEVLYWTTLREQAAKHAQL